LELVEEKRRLAQTLQQYETAFQKEKAKHQAQQIFPKNNEEITKILREKSTVEEKLKQREADYQDLKRENSNLAASRNNMEKKWTEEVKTRQKLETNVKELQKELQAVRGEVE
jgi:hypothetical protein